jgi:phosphate transport system permease protein
MSEQELPAAGEIYPQGDDAVRQISRRQFIGRTWGVGFLAAITFAIVVLTILLVTIVNQTAGYVAEQTAMPEQQLVTDFNKSLLVNAPGVALISEDDQALADGVAADPGGVGFLGFAFYQRNADRLQLVSIDGVTPTAETAASGEYLGGRPLALYSSVEVTDDKPQVAAFMLYYLEHAAEVMEEIGYFPVSPEAFEMQAQQIRETMGVESLPTIIPTDYAGDIRITGSSTLYPVTREIARRFRVEGFLGAIKIDSTGTGAGFDAFCAATEGIDIVNAGRPATQLESEACRGNGYPLTGVMIGMDALTVVVNPQNTFATDMSREQLETLMVDATDWNEVNDAWPSLPVAKYIPTETSGTMDVFVNSFFAEQTLQDVPFEGLVALYSASVSAGRCRAVESEQRFFADSLVCLSEEQFATLCSSASPPTGCTLEPRGHVNVENLIYADVVKPVVLKSWFLFDSFLNREEIAATIARNFPSAEMVFRRWLTLDFILSPQSSVPELAGVRTAIMGSLWVVAIAILFGFPLGVGAAIYLEEYADKTNRFNQIIQTNINNLAGVPSIIYGLLGLAVFVRALEPITSGCAFGFVDCTTANGRTILSAGLTLGLLVLPVIIIGSQEAIRAVPSSLREASMGLGATKWQTIWSHVLPNAFGGILTGVILGMSRVIGETAPLVVVGASTFINTDPTGPFSKFTTLPTQIYQWTSRPQATFLNIAGAAIIVLLVMLLILNATAIILRNRYSRKLV